MSSDDSTGFEIKRWDSFFNSTTYRGTHRDPKRADAGHEIKEEKRRRSRRNFLDQFGLKEKIDRYPRQLSGASSNG